MRNIQVSIRDRLAKVASESRTNFQLLLIRYFQERLLYRLSVSPDCDHFCLKGGALIYALDHDKSRPTLDLDFLGIRLAAQHDRIKQIFENICSIDFEPDGVEFDRDSITTSEITKEGKYPGIRAKLQARLGNIRQMLQIDIGFGDIVTPGPVKMQYPTILDLEPPEIQAYSVETIIAEKFEAMVDLGEANSRMKDFYDLYNLLIPGKYDEPTLGEAIVATFKNRSTPFSPDPAVFDDNFYTDPQRRQQWAAFLRKSALETIDFAAVGQRIKARIKPVFQG